MSKNITSCLFTIDNTPSDCFIYRGLCHPRDEPMQRGRQLCENLWSQYQKYADPNFITEFRQHTLARFWEMDLTCTFLERGFSISEQGGIGPDIVISHDESNIYIEAISPSPGRGRDQVPEMPMGISSEVPLEKIILRLTAAVEEKHNKYLKWIEDEFLAVDDKYVIAINAAQIPYARGPYDMPWILRCILPIGHQYASYDRKTSDHVDSGFLFTDTVSKENGSNVLKTYFLDPKYSGISAVIFSVSDFYNRPRKAGDDYVLVYNPLAKNPLPQNALGLTEEYNVTINDDGFKVELLKLSANHKENMARS